MARVVSYVGFVHTSNLSERLLELGMGWDGCVEVKVGGKRD
jgi:hypothetical protein